jgi:hypothetical protein
MAQQTDDSRKKLEREFFDFCTALFQTANEESKILKPVRTLKAD